MRYVSIDIETTGLNPSSDQVLEFGAVIEDTNNVLPIDDLPKFRRILIHKNISGNPFAIQMNIDIIRQIAFKSKDSDDALTTIPNCDSMFCFPEELAKEFYIWLINNGFQNNSRNKVKIVVAGKNVAGFDMKFLNAYAIELDSHVYAHQRVIDPGMLYIDWEEDDVPPDLKTCKQRAEIDGEVAHTAIDDAIDVIKLVRRYIQICRGDSHDE